MSKISDFIHQARKELLDLSGRNKLLNFKLPKARGIQLSDSASDIYKIIQQKNAMILPLPEEDEETKTPKSQIQLIKDDLVEQTDNESEAALIKQALADIKKQVNLGYKYQKGEGVKKDLKLAYYWYSRAYKNGEDYVLPARNSIYSSLTEKQKKEYDEFFDKNIENSFEDLEPKQKTIKTNKQLLGLQTDYEFKTLERRIKKTGGEARSYIEERGVNVLYLALGFLNWFEEKDKDNIFKAPLALTPVALKISQDKKTFFVQSFEEEDIDLHENITLRTKLENDFNIKLPELLDEKEGFDLDEYFNQVEESISKQKDWKVDRNFNVIGFFDFSKFVMYADLTEDNWIDGNHPDWSELLKILLDPKQHFRDGGGLDLKEDDRLEDHVSPDEPTAVLDADSSQAKAILDVRDGKHLVIQGPPGTGKSQTITNIIADAFRHDKKVLFVSEKMAALEVVKKRLEQVNLGDAALELHSNKTNKKEFYEELGRVLKLGKPSNSKLDYSAAELQDTVKELHDYADAINTQLDSGFTPIQIIGLLDQAKNEIKDISTKSEDLELLNSKKDKLISLSFEGYIKNIDAIESMIQQLLKMGSPKQHPYYGSNIENLLDSDKKLLKDNLSKTFAAFEDYLNHKNELDKYTDTNLKFKEIKNYIEKYSSSPDIAALNLNIVDWQKNEDYLEVLERLRKIHRTKTDSKDEIIEAAWEMDLISQRGTLNTKGRKVKVAQWFDSELKQAVRDVQKIFSQKPEKDPLSLIEWIDKIEEVKKDVKYLELNQDLMKKLFKDSWKGELSDHVDLKEKAEFFKSLVDANDDTSNYIFKFAEKGLDKDKLNSDLEILSQKADELDNWIQKIDQVLNLDTKYNINEGHFYDYEIGEKIKSLNENINKSEEWISYLKLKNDLAEIEWFIPIMENWSESFNYVAPFFAYAVMESKAKDMMSKFSPINNFEIISHTKLVDRFKELDLNLQQARQFEMLEKHFKAVSTVRHSTAGQISTIMREINKKSRKLPIRKLMLSAAQAVQHIKPIFMMSPLSLASYIPPRSVHFDLIIFDEASQVKSVDALGAALRGDQLVVVGDSKQMPPTSFFDAQMSDDYEDEDEYYDNQDNISATQDMESILKLMESQNAPQRMLQWHYRSKFASLINASNYLYYDSRLVTYPASDEEDENNGLIFNFVKNGVYDRGGKRSNEKEAEVVAQAVLKHAREHSDLSLGVVGLSQAQKNELENQIELLANDHGELSRFMDKHGPHEQIFIKNLETVQGDERDVIFISIGYGKTKEGYFSNSFGPINNDGGERRLNVLISRARKRCEVFSSIHADEIKDSDKRGAQDLKTFLKYAETGILDEVKETGEGYGSDFERQVQKAVAAFGYTVDTQVGSAGFKIDLAVRDKKNPNRYILAIECDGAAYHSSYSARDRDRLRQEILEDRGWTFHRVWSTAWFRSPEEETKKILESIKKSESTDKIRKKTKQAAEIKFDREEEVEIDFDVKSYKKPAWVKPYKKYDVVWTKSKDAFYDYRGNAHLRTQLVNLIEQESPINFNLIKRRISKGVGFSRGGANVENVIINALNYLARDKEIIYKDDIARHPDENLTIRDRSKLSDLERDISFISDIEIQEAAKKRMEGSIGADWKDIIPLIAKDFGFARCTEEMTKHISKLLSKIFK